eukprot:1845485-Amphidinium_carterae.1
MSHRCYWVLILAVCKRGVGNCLRVGYMFGVPYQLNQSTCNVSPTSPQKELVFNSMSLSVSKQVEVFIPSYVGAWIEDEDS